ncbi:TPA: hypothetical protein QHU19_003168 [Klebsiella aerogenes]|uniref:contact-dependent growth inhibition system immunity protein n=1 Tax=Klebsiella aerogenes TaxID=548 RepID=UPI0012FF1AC7|nr:contact-dependent growth inhibition system immunity protein [Klebsiella aerogenes]EKW5209220.1 hypothetical protein [Klebsiella aerogenes]ELS4537420.1 hypothetical protein [Klebsiella aerogenes]EMB4313709.1 hypothetical protein [Klebsiella aerogenes]EMB4650523.1 hypothetical protein [Klebsiella aerogenes]HBW4583536.1 hypothetical protein [Klebsiella aerogenes]
MFAWCRKKQRAPHFNYPAGQEIDTFIESYRDRQDDEFKSRYGYDFSPELWETTTYEFLKTVRRLALT